MNGPSATRRADAGFTLVETMVAILIGMLTTLIIMQVYATSEGSKRTITSGADAQSDAAAALYLIERDLRQAGYGFAPNTEDFVPAYTAPPAGVLTTGVLALCSSVRATNSNRATTTDFVYSNSTFAPVVINPTGFGGDDAGAKVPDGDAGTDIIMVTYSNSNGVIGRALQVDAQDTGGNVQSFKLKAGSPATPDARAGFVQGDLFLAVPAPGSGFDCMLGEVTGLPPQDDNAVPCSVNRAPPSPMSIERNSVTYSNYYTGCAGGTTAVWNKIGADVDYTNGALYNLGPAPHPEIGLAGAFTSRVYAVRKGNLTVCDFSVNDCTAAVDDPPDPTVWVPIANDVVGLRAEYGKDTNFDGAINAWDATTLTGTNIAKVIAVRLAMVVRSSQYDRDVVTTAEPVWHADLPLTADFSFDLATLLGASWNHYRYKTVQSVVPLRNMIWGEQN